MKLAEYDLNCRQDGEDYYIGLYKETPTINGVTYWLDGNNSTYRQYDSGEPNDDKSCFRIEGNEGALFKDEDCDSTKYYICKITSGMLSGQDYWPVYCVNFRHM